MAESVRQVVERFLRKNDYNARAALLELEFNNSIPLEVWIEALETLRELAMKEK